MGRTRDVTLAIRTTQDVREVLNALAAAMSEELGTRVSKTQALEAALTEALRKRETS